MKFILHNPAVLAALGAWIFSAAVQNLPAPGPDSRKLYRFLYGFLNTLGANFSHVALGSSPMNQKKGNEAK